MTTWSDERVEAMHTGWTRTLYAMRWHHWMSKSDQETYMRTWAKGRKDEDDNNIKAPKGRAQT